MAADTELERRVAELETRLNTLTHALRLLNTVIDVHQSALLALAKIDAETSGGDPIQEMTPAQLADLMPEYEFETINGKVKIADVPMGANGFPTEDWAVQNCPCPAHTAMREAPHDTTDGLGQYL